MCRIAHLSDLHFRAGGVEPAFDAMLEALREERRARGDFDLLVITGDVFDDAAIEPTHAARKFSQSHTNTVLAFGGKCATVIVPGNHDRRRHGLFAPHRVTLFDELARQLGDRAVAHGNNLPFLSQVVDPAVHGLPIWLVADDSSFLPKGLMSRTPVWLFGVWVGRCKSDTWARVVFNRLMAPIMPVLIDRPDAARRRFRNIPLSSAWGARLSLVCERRERPCPSDETLSL